MRLAEIITRPFEVLFTKQFVKDYASFAKAWPTLAETFEEFLRSKQEDWRRPFGQKDKAGTALLKGWWHCHLVFGKAILSYDNNQSRIRCARITDHLSVEGTGIKIRGLVAYLASLSDDDFVASKMPSAEREVDTRQVELARDLFYEMAANREDRLILQAFANGSSDDAVEFFAVTEPPIDPARAGGMDAMRKVAGEVLRTVPMTEGRSADNEGGDDLPSRGFRLKDGREAMVHAFTDYEEDCIAIYVTVGGEAVADAKFDPARSYFRNVEVNVPFRRLGVASAIYSYVEQQGYHVTPSNNVRPDGERFWAARKRERLGQAQRLIPS